MFWLKSNPDIAEKRAGGFLLWGLVLLPILSFPVFGLPASATAYWLWLGSLVAALGFSLYGDRKRGQAPKFFGWLAGGLSLVLVVRFLSAIFSGAFFSSFLGHGFETGSVSFVLVFAVLYFLVNRHFLGPDRWLAFIFGLLIFIAAGSLLALLRFFFSGLWLTLAAWPAGWFGEWSELGIVAGLMAVMTLGLLQFFSFSDIRFLKPVLKVLLALSIAFLAFINYRAVFPIVALTAFAILLSASLPLVKLKNGRFWRAAFWRPALVLIVSSGLFIFPSINLISYDKLVPDLDGKLMEVRPNLANSLSVARAVLAESPILGLGPAKWNAAWQRHKPLETNNTPFWAADFSSGHNFLVTEAASTGYAGLAAWLLFICFGVWRGLRAIVCSPAERKPFAWLFLFGFLYLAAFLFIYSPGLLILIWLLSFAAVLNLLAAGEKTVEARSLDERGRIKFALLAVAGIFMSYLLVANIVSSVAVSAVRRADSPVWRERFIVMALIFPRDYIYREAADIGLERIKALLSDRTASGDLVDNFGRLSGRAFARANSAVNLDPLNYRNYQARGRLAESLVPLGAVAGASEKASRDYNKAIELSPSHPGLFLDLARLSSMLKENDQTQFYVDQALKLKPDYAPALLLESQLLALAGDIETAIATARRASDLSPRDGAMLFQWGYLLYRNSEYDKAEAVLLRAAVTSFSPSTVRYYLALCAQKVGRLEEAITFAEEAVATDPGHEDARLLLVKLRQPVKK